MWMRPGRGGRSSSCSDGEGAGSSGIPDSYDRGMVVPSSADGTERRGSGEEHRPGQQDCGAAEGDQPGPDPEVLAVGDAARLGQGEEQATDGVAPRLRECGGEPADLCGSPYVAEVRERATGRPAASPIAGHHRQQ